MIKILPTICGTSDVIASKILEAPMDYSIDNDPLLAAARMISENFHGQQRFYYTQAFDDICKNVVNSEFWLDGNEFFVRYPHAMDEEMSLQEVK